MSIPNIKKLYCLQRPSQLSPPRGSLSPAQDRSYSRGSLPKISILNESVDTKQNSVSFRTDIRTDKLHIPLSKAPRSASVVDIQESAHSMSRISYLNTETDREPIRVRKENQNQKFNMWKRVTEIKSILSQLQNVDKQRIFPQKLSVKKVIECLETMNEPSSNLSDLMSMIVAILKSAIYINPTQVELYAKTFSFIESEELKRLLSSTDNIGVPYYSIIKTVVKDLNKEKHLKYQELEKAYIEKIRVIQDLDGELKRRITKKDHTLLLREMERLRENVKCLEEENKKLKSQNEALNARNSAQANTLYKDVDEIEALSWKISDLESEKENLQKDLQKEYKKMQELQNASVMFKEFKEKSFGKLVQVKKQLHDLRTENQRLTNENTILNGGAASGFRDLTPRPDYQAIQENQQVALDMYKKRGGKEYCPTSYIVEELVNRIQHLSQNLTGAEQSEKSEMKKPVIKRIVKKETNNNSLSPVKVKSSDCNKKRAPSTLTERKNRDGVKVVKKGLVKKQMLLGTNTLGDEERNMTLSTRISQDMPTDSDVGNIARREITDSPKTDRKSKIRIEKARDETPSRQKREMDPAEELLMIIVNTSKELEKCQI